MSIIDAAEGVRPCLRDQHHRGIGPKAGWVAAYPLAVWAGMRLLV